MRAAFWWIAVGVVGLDQWTKALMHTRLQLDVPLPILGQLLFFTHVHNYGSAFGQLQGAGPFLSVAALIAAAAIVTYRSRVLRRGGALHPLLLVGLALPLGGALGNMLDRLRLGYVEDFIDIRVWPVFNVADSAISLGAVALALFFLFGCQNPGEVLPGKPALARECGSEPGA